MQKSLSRIETEISVPADLLGPPYASELDWTADDRLLNAKFSAYSMLKSAQSLMGLPRTVPELDSDCSKDLDGECLE